MSTGSPPVPTVPAVWVPGGSWNASLVGVDPVSGRARSVRTWTMSVCGVTPSGRDVVLLADPGTAGGTVVVRVDAASGRELARGHVADRAYQPVLIGGTVWVSAGRRLVGLDRHTLVQRTTWPLAEPLVAVAGAGDLLWGVTSSGVLLAVDPATGDVVRRRPLGVLPADVDGLVHHGQHLWVADARRNQVVVVDPAGPRAVRSVPLGGGRLHDPFGQNVRGLLVARGQVWAYHLRAPERWALTPVGRGGAEPGKGLDLPDLGMCSVTTDGRDVWFGGLPDDLTRTGISRADLSTRTVSRVAGVAPNDTYDLVLAP